MNYIDIEQAKIIHSATIKISGGGDEGLINIGSLESVLCFIQNEDYYATFEAKLTHLIYSVNKNHSFLDGNKRLSIALGVEFLLINGYYRCIAKFIQEMENISYHIAAGKVNDTLLAEVINSIINNIDFSESLKLEIYKAMIVSDNN